MRYRSYLLLVSWLALACGSAQTKGEDTGGETTGDGDGTGTTSGTGTGTSGSTMPPVDMGESGGGEPCDPIAQDCPDGYKCSEVPLVPGSCSYDISQCTELGGELGLGEFCSHWGDGDDCASGLTCGGYSVPDYSDACVRACEVPACIGTAPDPSPICEAAGMVGATCFESAQYTWCAHACDPLASTCPDGQGCYLTGRSLNCLPISAGASTIGGPCTGWNDCEIGHACWPAELLTIECGAEFCCTAFCDPESGDADCSNGMSCTGIDGPSTPSICLAP